MDARRTGVEADRVGVGDKVDLVPARGQFHAQLGGDDAAAAVRWITGDADVHAISVAHAAKPGATGFACRLEH